jgi:putative transcriptional regulator
MSAVFDDIMDSLNELKEAAEGKPNGVVVHRRTMKMPETFTPQEIKQVRLDAKMTQKTFAACIGVTPKAVEAWEGGRSRPDGAARRLLGLMRDHPNFAETMGIYR